MRAVAPLAFLVAFAGCLSGLPTPGAEDIAPENVADGRPLGPGYVAALRLDAALAADAGSPTTLYASRVVDTFAGVVNGLAPPRPYEVLLTRSAILTPDSWAEIDGARVEFPDVDVYDGVVKDVEGSLVRLVVTPEWVRGSIVLPDYVRRGNVEVLAGEVTALIRYNLNGNLPHGTLEPPPPPGGPTGPMYVSEDQVLYDAPGWEEQECLSLVPTAVQPRVLSTGTVLDSMLPAETREMGTITAKLVMDADGYAYEMLGRHTLPILVAMLAETDIIYEHQLGIRLQLAGVHAHTDPAAIGNWTQGQKHDELAAYWNARPDIDRDVVHLVGGENTAYGIANCIGGAGIPEIAYTFTPLPWEQMMPVFHTTAIAHELGHIFDAHHHYGNHAQTAGRGATIMIQGYTPGARNVFGTLERATIRGWAEEYIVEGLDGGAGGALLGLR